MKIVLIPLMLILLTFTNACGFERGNPLLELSDRQFAEVMGLEPNCFWRPPCFDLFYDAHKLSYTYAWTVQSCVSYVAKIAKEIGVSTPIKLAHLQAPLVKERYLKLRNKIP